MSNDIVIVQEKNELQITDGQIAALDDRIKKMKSFVQNQLKKGIDNDYAVIPGTPKPSLLKPGAEKILLLFKLGFRFEIMSEIVDFVEGTVSFMVRCIVFRKDDGGVVGESIGYCTNKEKKYIRLQAADSVNTILKMAQKRSLVGAAIAATGASDYFSQDMEEDGPREKATVERFKKPAQEQEASNDLGAYVCGFGKYKDQSFNQIGKENLINYCTWLKKDLDQKGKEPDGAMKELLDRAREFCR